MPRDLFEEAGIDYKAENMPRDLFEEAGISMQPVQQVQQNQNPLMQYIVNPAKQIAGAIVEPAGQMATGFIAKPISEIAGMTAAARELISPIGGDPEAFKQDVYNQIAYQPRTQGGKFVSKNILEPIGSAIGYVPKKLGEYVKEKTGSEVAASGAEESALQGLNIAGVGGAKPVLRYVKDKAGLASSYIDDMQAAKQTALAEQSRLNAAKIDAAKKAAKLKIAVNPAEANPTVMNKIKSGIVGAEELGTNFSIKNESRWPMLAKEDLGLPKGKSLTIDLFEEGRAKYTEPYNKIRNIETIPTDAEYINNIRNKNFLENLPPEEQALLAGSKKVEKLINSASLPEFTGAGAIEIIKQFRAEANKIFGSTTATPKQTAFANAQLKVAKELESNIGRRLQEMHIENPSAGYKTLANDLKNAREYFAKSYTYQNATNLATHKIDPKKIAKIAESDNALTGILKDIGDIAANYPLSSRIGLEESMTRPKFIRNTLGGTAGAIAGGAIGGYPGMLIGAPLGFTTEVALENIIKNRLARPSSQLSNLPKDYRPLREQLGYTDNVLKNVIPDNKLHPDTIIPQDETGLTLAPKGARIGPIRYIEPELQTRGLLSLLDENIAKNKPIEYKPGEVMDFKLRQEALQNPMIIKRVRDYQTRANELENLIENAGGFWKNRYAAELEKLKQDFADFMRPYGIKTPEQATGLRSPLYEGKATRFPIVKGGGMFTKE